MVRGQPAVELRLGGRALTGVTGISSAIGGTAWTLGCFVHNSLPQGCIADACEGPHALPMRGSSPVAVAFFTVAGVMLAVSGVGLLVLTRRHGGRGRAALVAVLAGGLGGALLLAAGIVSWFVDSDWSGMPALVVPGVVLVAVGAALLGWIVLRARLLPTPLALLLLFSALLLPLANEQTSRILLAVPFGVAWFVAGVTVGAHRTSVGVRAARSAT
jgi:hypothetical protein